MTEKNNLKARVRARMAETGEPYTVARRAVLALDAARAGATAGRDLAAPGGVVRGVFPTGPRLSHEFPLGTAHDGRPVVWDVTAEPHLTVSGDAARGKTTTLRTVLLHAMTDPRWAVLGPVDPEGSFRWLDEAQDEEVPAYARTLDETVKVLSFAAAMARDRAVRAAAGDPDGFRVLVVVDDVALCTAQEDMRPEGPRGARARAQDRNMLRAAASGLLLALARDGAAAGVHLAVSGWSRSDLDGALGPVEALRVVLGPVPGVWSLQGGALVTSLGGAVSYVPYGTPDAAGFRAAVAALRAGDDGHDTPAA